MVNKVEEVHIVYGQVCVDEFTGRQRWMSPEFAMDPQLAHALGASFVVGTPEAIGLVKENLSSYQQESRPLSEPAIHWLATGKRGLSSDTIFKFLTGVETFGPALATEYPAVPNDSGDLRRCFQLLEQVPEFKQRFFSEMPKCSPAWKEILEIWPLLEAPMNKSDHAAVHALLHKHETAAH